jgi:hypothetical protein
VPTAARKATWTPEQLEAHRRRDREATRRRKDARIDAWRRENGLCGLEQWKAAQHLIVAATNRLMNARTEREVAAAHRELRAAKKALEVVDA